MNNYPLGQRGLIAVVIIAIVLATAVYLFLQRSTVPGIAAASEMTVYKHPRCGCCTLWVEHVESAGIKVTAEAQPDAIARWDTHGIAPELGACHTAVIDGYTIEGHVPVEDIRRLLTERPDAVGLVVPGMPLGSPGMEGPDPEPYNVLLLKRDGTTQVFQRHTGRNHD